MLGTPALTAVLFSVREQLGLGSVPLIYLLAIVAIAVVGGLVPAVIAAVASFLLVNWFLTPPYFTFQVAGRDRLIQLFVFVVTAILVSVIVDMGARNLVSAERNRMEARLLAGLASSEIGATRPEGVLTQIRDLFELAAVELVDPTATGQPVLVATGQRDGAPPNMTFRTRNNLELRGYGLPRFAEDSRLLRTLAETAARAWEERRLADEAARAEQLAETDRVRAALLAAVGHDLRTPLAGIKAAVSTLRETDIEWSAEQVGELLGSIEKSTDRLTDVITNLLAMSRIQAGALSVHLAPVTVDEVVGRALLHADAPQVEVDVRDDLPTVLADAALLERVVANLLSNAARFSRPGEDLAVTARTTRMDQVILEVIDHGPGVPPARWGDMFLPFQRLGDRDSRTGVGLGLAIARGLCDAMNVGLGPGETPGGGLTMTLTLPVVAPR